MEIVHVLAATTLLHRYDIKPKRYADRNRPGSGSFSTCVVLSGHVGSSFIIFSSIYSIYIYSILILVYLALHLGGKFVLTAQGKHVVSTKCACYFLLRML